MNKTVIETLKSICDAGRADALVLEEKARNVAKTCLEPDMYEARDQAMLAVRHLEDARMRLGKVIQHLSGGVSIYDKAKPND